MEVHILICEDSLEGVFTAVYRAYEKRYAPETTEIQTSEEGNLRLFAVYDRVPNDREKSERVIRTLQKRFGEEGFYILCMALASTDAGKGTAVYRTIARGLGSARPDKVFDRHADPDVGKVCRLKCNVWNEMHHLFGFVRFRELQNGILLSEIQPKNNVLPYLADHFADRLPRENFLLYDAGRKVFAVHQAGKDWFLAAYPDFKRENMEESKEEGMCQELFRHFCHKIAIEARNNAALQRGMLPLRFRPYMTEFSEAFRK